MPDNAVLFIHALTGLHPGSGTALGVVDLPVQRERHTDWPVIPGSSLKGVLRETCRARSSRDDPLLLAAFGPETSDASDHAGALALTDARILAFPVRSLRGVFAWVTCPAALGRLTRDLSLAGAGVPGDIPEVGTGEAYLAGDSPLLVDGDKLVLEEFEFERKGSSDAVAEWIAERAVNDAGTGARIRRQLVILSDDDFTHFVRHATEVLARVGLDYERKTVRKGALFYEEFLPAETVFYSLVLASDSRRQDVDKKSADFVAYLRDAMPPVLQIGADETIGKGFCAVNLVNGGGDG